MVKRRDRDGRDIAHLVLGFFTGVVITVLSFGVFGTAPDASERCERYERVMLAYRHCLQGAGKLQCRMTPDDFVEYYRVKHILEQCHGSQTD